MKAPHRVAFFGGTFDPIHLGHLEIAQKARRALQLDEIIFIPCRRSPHKDSAPGANDQERLKMLTLATADLPWARVSDFELITPPPSYTWKTLTALIPTLPKETRSFLLIGLDQWEALPRWQHPERIASMAEFIVVGRNGTPTSRPGCRAHFIQGNHPASASAIRKAISQGKTPEWLPEKIRTYLRKNSLYVK